mmetsp:Transcript_36321/g.73994  ORF Transcript_36321/g.73994 Transcript_36321/m.73994 type:complete len:256 (+) Transcript_36321:86-853(+)
MTLVAPTFCGDASVWCDSADQPSVNESSLQIFLATITKCNPQRAGDALLRLLQRPTCSDVKDVVWNAVSSAASCEATLPDRIIAGIKEAIEHHTNSKGGTRTTAAETFVKNAVTACVWAIVKDGDDVSRNKLVDLLGTTDNQIKAAVTLARELIEKKTFITELERAQRSDYIRDELLPFLLDWLEDDTVTRFDSNQSHVEIEDPMNPGKTLTKVGPGGWLTSRYSTKHSKSHRSAITSVDSLVPQGLVIPSSVTE